MPRILYHFPTSPFSRRTRLALAHKGLDVELRDARADPSQRDIAGSKWPLRTIPVLVDGQDAIGDSTAIVRWIDAKYPERPVFSADDVRLELAVTTIVDGVLNILIDMGTRYHVTKEDMLGRANDAASELSRISPQLSGWSASEIWLYSMVAWLQGLPARVESNANVKKIVSLGFILPEPLSIWAAKHAQREDVRGLDP
jgi:glutathione S-transferase